MTNELRAALRCIYGHDEALLVAQGERYQRDLALFARRYGSGTVSVFRAPGRVNLIGEHTDYNHGFVLPMALDRDMLILARPRRDNRVRLTNYEAGFPDRQFEIRPDIPPRPIGDWANYAQGPAQLLAREQGADLRGCDCLVDSALPYGVPRGAGLSSSSALTVAAAATLAGLNDIPLEGAALAESCGRAEWYVGTRGGIMDQFSSALSKQGHALFLDCRPQEDGSYRYEHVPIPEGFDVVVVDSRVRHCNTGPHYNRRVAEGRIGVRLLQAAFPGITHLRDVNDVHWSELEPLLPDVIHSRELVDLGIDPDRILGEGVRPETDTFYVRRRCRHVISENKRVQESVAALWAGDMALFGRLLREAHASARDDYEISLPEIETLVRIAQAQPGVVGARLTGAGWGGCIVAVVEQAAVHGFSDAVSRAYRAETGHDGRAFPCRSAAGAGLAWRTTI